MELGVDLNSDNIIVPSFEMIDNSWKKKSSIPTILKSANNPIELQIHGITYIGCMGFHCQLKLRIIM